MLALCPVCFSGIVFTGQITHCPECGTTLAEDDLLADDEILCDECNVTLEWDQRRCVYCHTEYPKQYWSNLSYHLNQSWQDELVDLGVDEAIDNISYNRLDPVQEISEISWLFNLCCDSHYENCKCSLVIGWEESYDVPHEIREVAYDYRSECSSCMWFYTPSCLPLRSWYMDYLETGEIPDSIDICTNYLLDPTCVSVEIGASRSRKA